VKIACVCVTWNRPAQLAEAVESFLRQTYPAELRELVIVDDAGQYAPTACDGLPGVKLASQKERFRTLGEKRNAAAELVSADVEALAVWDDDDIYLPRHLEALAEVLAVGHQWVRPAAVWRERNGVCQRFTLGIWHGAWAYTREAFQRAHGYPAISLGEDKGLAVRFARLGICEHFPAGPPTYVYRWQSYPGARNLTALDSDGYVQRGRETIEPVARIVPRWTRDWVEMVARSVA